MNDVEQLRQVMELNFQHQADVLARIERQTTRTNGRADRLEEQMATAAKTLAGLHERVQAQGREIGDLKRARPDSSPDEELVGRLEGLLTRAETGQERSVKIWMVSGVVAVIVGTVVFLNFFGFLKKPGDVVTQAPAAVIR